MTALEAVAPKYGAREHVVTAHDFSKAEDYRKYLANSRTDPVAHAEYVSGLRDVLEQRVALHRLLPDAQPGHLRDAFDMVTRSRRYFKKYTQNPTEARTYWGTVMTEFGPKGRGYAPQQVEELAWAADMYLAQYEDQTLEGVAYDR